MLEDIFDDALKPNVREIKTETVSEQDDIKLTSIQ